MLKNFKLLISIPESSGHITDIQFINKVNSLLITNNTTSIQYFSSLSIHREIIFKSDVTEIIYDTKNGFTILSTPTNALTLIDASFKPLHTLPKGYPYISPSQQSPNHSLPITSTLFSQNTNSLENLVTISTDRSIRYWTIKEKRITCLKTLIFPSQKKNDYKFIKGVAVKLKERKNIGYMILTEPGKLYFLNCITCFNFGKSPNNFLELFCNVHKLIENMNEVCFVGLLNVDNRFIVLLEAESGTLIIIDIVQYSNVETKNKNEFYKIIKHEQLQTNHTKHYKMDYIKSNKEEYTIYIPSKEGCIGTISINTNKEISKLHIEDLKSGSDNVCITCYVNEHIFVGNLKGDVYYSFENKSLFKRRKEKDDIMTGSVIKTVGEYKESIDIKEDTKKVKLSHKYGNLPIEKQIKPGQGKDNM